MKTKLAYERAFEKANQVMRLLAPHVERIEIAGSLRRKRPEVGDIELVAIPKMIADFDMFGTLAAPVSALDTINWFPDIGMPRKSGSHYKQIDLGEIGLDLFITSCEQWGVIYTLRTGNSVFSHKLVTARKAGGLLPSYLRIKDGRVWNGNEPLDTPEEADVFRVAQIAWIPPEERNYECW